jgi:hypothetical protein
MLSRVCSWFAVLFFTSNDVPSEDAPTGPKHVREIGFHVVKACVCVTECFVFIIVIVTDQNETNHSERSLSPCV